MCKILYVVPLNVDFFLIKHKINVLLKNKITLPHIDIFVFSFYAQSVGSCCRNTRKVQFKCPPVGGSKSTSFTIFNQS